MPFCSSCGNNLAGAPKFCAGCGAAFGASSASSSAPAKKHAPVQAAAPFRSGASTAYGAPASFNAINKTPASHIPEYQGNNDRSSSSGRLSTAKPLNQINALCEVQQGKQQSSFGESNVIRSNDSSVVKCGLATTTYEKQPDWAYAEKHKNTAGQFRVGQFAHLNK